MLAVKLQEATETRNSILLDTTKALQVKIETEAKFVNENQQCQTLQSRLLKLKENKYLYETKIEQLRREFEDKKDFMMKQVQAQTSRNKDIEMAAKRRRELKEIKSIATIANEIKQLEEIELLKRRLEERNNALHRAIEGDRDGGDEADGGGGVGTSIGDSAVGSGINDGLPKGNNRGNPVSMDSKIASRENPYGAGNEVNSAEGMIESRGGGGGHRRVKEGAPKGVEGGAKGGAKEGLRLQKPERHEALGGRGLTGNVGIGDHVCEPSNFNDIRLDRLKYVDKEEDETSAMRTNVFRANSIAASWPFTSLDSSSARFPTHAPRRTPYETLLR